MLDLLVQKLKDLLAKSITDVPDSVQRCAMICHSDHCTRESYEKCEKRLAYLKLERDD